MLFHECSEYIYTWLRKQNHVKEESLTDWMLYEISRKCNFIHYQAFSRHEEAKNGSDWEWWVLTPDCSGKHRYNAYRFLVQAKKLFADDKDNYPLINYSNRYGTQVDLLLDSARDKNALPLYMYYSICRSNVIEQIRNVSYISEYALRWCENCTNGCYLSLAQTVYELIYHVPRKRILDSQLLDRSFKLSILDLIFKENKKMIDRILDDFNNELMGHMKSDDYINFNQSFRGIKHNEETIPQYVAVFIQNMNEDLNWLEKEMKIKDISGMGIIDLRNEEEY